MTKAIAIVIALGLAIGIIGGIVGGERWSYAGGLVAVVGVCALYAFGILKNPLGVVKAEAQVEAEFSGYPPNAGVKPEQQQATRTTQEERPPVPSNGTHHTDARATASLDQPSSARAGERKR